MLIHIELNLVFEIQIDTNLADGINLYCSINWGTRWRSWLRHCATSRKVAGSIPDGVVGIFH